MLVNELEEIWGIPIKILREYNKKYKRSTTISYIADIVIFSIAVYFMLLNNVSYQSYLFCCIVFCIGFTMYSNTLINKDKAEACRFYRIFKNKKVVKKEYNLSEQRLYSILYCSGCKRVKEGKNMDYYLDLLISLCSENYTNAKTLMKYISRYEADEENQGNIVILSTSRGKKQYFLGYEQLNSDYTSEEESEED